MGSDADTVTTRTVATDTDTASGRLEAELASARPGPGAPACGAAGHLARPDETLEVEVIRCLPGALALVRAPAGTEEVGVTLVDAGPGDRVLVHDGEAIAVLQPSRP